MSWALVVGVVGWLLLGVLVVIAAASRAVDPIETELLEAWDELERSEELADRLERRGRS